MGVDKEGNKIVTITKAQQHRLNADLLSWQQCRERERVSKEYSEKLELQLQDYQLVLEQHDTTSKQASIMFANRQEKIAQLTKQIEIKDLSLGQCIKERKILKRRILGWKIGAGVTIGVTAIAVPLIILLK